MAHWEWNGTDEPTEQSRASEMQRHLRNIWSDYNNEALVNQSGRNSSSYHSSLSDSVSLEVPSDTTAAAPCGGQADYTWALRDAPGSHVTRRATPAPWISDDDDAAVYNDQSTRHHEKLLKTVSASSSFTSTYTKTFTEFENAIKYGRKVVKTHKDDDYQTYNESYGMNKSFKELQASKVPDYSDLNLVRQNVPAKKYSPESATGKYGTPKSYKKVANNEKTTTKQPWLDLSDPSYTYWHNSQLADSLYESASKSFETEKQTNQKEEDILWSELYKSQNSTFFNSPESTLSDYHSMPNQTVQLNPKAKVFTLDNPWSNMYDKATPWSDSYFSETVSNSGEISTETVKDKSPYLQTKMSNLWDNYMFEQKNATSSSSGTSRKSPDYDLIDLQQALAGLNISKNRTAKKKIDATVLYDESIWSYQHEVDHSLLSPVNTSTMYHSTPMKNSNTAKSLVFQNNSVSIKDPYKIPQNLPHASFQDIKHNINQRLLTGQSEPIPWKLPMIEQTHIEQKTVKSKKSRKVLPCCHFCQKNGESANIFLGHNLKVKKAKKYIITCPILRSLICPVCAATGDDAHTETYCPVVRGNNDGVRPVPTAVLVKSTRTSACGKPRY